MSIRFLTDSASDILPEEAKALGITVAPISVTFGEETYADGVTIGHQEFYEKLAKSETLPSTSQINPAIYEDYFNELTANGDEVVVVTLSSGLSGTYQSAMIAAADFEGKVYVVDSMNATVGQRILLLRGLELAKQGWSAAEIADALNEEKGKIRVMAIIDTLEYLKKGGRISATVALAGGLLAIKPAVQIKDGKVALAGTARGVKKCHALLTELIEQYGGVNFDKPMALVYADDDALLRQFISDNPQLWQGHDNLPAYGLGCTIGAHIGPNAYGVAFFEK